MRTYVRTSQHIIASKYGQPELNSLSILEEHCYKRSENYSEISDFQSSFDVLDVRKELSKVNPCKSMGPDGIHLKIIKSLANDSGFVEASCL